MTPKSKLAADALRIWQAGVAGAQPARLFAECTAVEGNILLLGEEAIDLRPVRKIAVVGAGKAAAEMAAAFEGLLGERLAAEKQLFGWVNAPAGATATPRHIRVHHCRPRGVNEPTAEAERGAREILRIIGELGTEDLCICLISGGASALLPAPIRGVTLADKIRITRELSARGASIIELNAVRTALSDIKGGGLARACRAGQLATLILSDVPGDDLATIGSGPTVLAERDPRRAAEILKKTRIQFSTPGEAASAASVHLSPLPKLTHVLIGNNAAAIDAAGVEAERLGYSHAMLASTAPEGDAEEVGRQLAAMAARMRDETSGPNCLITGGEPTVRLAAADVRGLGGRNQQLALAALATIDDWRGIALLSGGTDGEDGPTDAAGAWVDEHVGAKALELKLDPHVYLNRKDAYRFFDAAGGLLRTGPTGTNVCDVRVVCVVEKR